MFYSAASLSVLLTAVTAAVQNGIDLGTCTEEPTIEFGTGFPGSANANEFRFRPQNQNTFSGQSTALNGNIIGKFLCDRVNDKCNAPQATKDLCTLKAIPAFAAEFAKDGGGGGRASGGSAADAFNAVWNVKTTFANIANSPAAAGPVGNLLNGIDLGTCTEEPTIEFGTGFPGSANANEFRFRPQNQNTFSGQSTALNGNIIGKFLCDRVNDKCKAPQATKDLCTLKAIPAFTAEFAKDGGGGGRASGGSAADAFNAIWNVKTNFAALSGGGSAAAPPSGVVTSTTASVAATAVASAGTTPAAAAVTAATSSAGQTKKTVTVTVTQNCTPTV